MKEKILKLRREGKSYNEIKNILGCSKSTISYHCGENQKEKNKKRGEKRREGNPLIKKTENFIYNYRYCEERIRKFQKRDNSMISKVNSKIEASFKWTDVVSKFGNDTVCYLSGEKINLLENMYSLDHIIPASRGGSNDFNNLGILHKVVNVMKSDLTPIELIEWCRKILEFNGFDIKKKEDNEI